MPSRRDLLAAFGTAAVASGCLGSPSGSAADSTGTDAPPATESTSNPTASPSATPESNQVGDTVTLGAVDMTVDRVVVQDSLVHAASPDSMNVDTQTGERYVLAEISVAGSNPPAAAAFSLLADGDAVATGGTLGFGFYGGPRRTHYHRDGDGGWVNFVVPASMDVQLASVAVENARWSLGERTVERLRDPLAEFELVEFAVPRAVTPDTRFEAAVTVENVGDVAGTFRGVLNVAGGKYAMYPYPFALDVPPGERGTWRREFSTAEENLDGPGDGMQFDLRTAVGIRESSLEVVAGTAVGTADVDG